MSLSQFLNPFSTCLLTEKKKIKKISSYFFLIGPSFAASMHLGFLIPLAGHSQAFCSITDMVNYVLLALTTSLQSIPSTLLQLLKFGWFLCSSAIATCETQTFFVALPITLVSLSHCYVTFWQFCLPY